MPLLRKLITVKTRSFMNKFLYLFCFILPFFAFSQNYTVAQVEKSDDARVIANFIKHNPNHPKTPEFKRKLFAVINNKKTPAQQAAVAKPKVAPLSKQKLKNDVRKDIAKDGVNNTNRKTVDLLNHLFNNDPNRRQAYIQIENLSKCNMIVKISGKKFYNLNVPAQNKNFILVDKGSYTLSTNVCDAKYSSKKNVTQDIVVTLTPPRRK